MAAVDRSLKLGYAKIYRFIICDTIYNFINYEYVASLLRNLDLVILKPQKLTKFVTTQL
jgi:hypothetical protein